MYRYLILLLFLCLTTPSSAQTESTDAAKTDTAGGAQFHFFNNDRAHDFGAIYLNGNAEYRFDFRNTGDQPLIIKEMRSVAKGMNAPPYKVIVNYPQGPIKPGKKGSITVTVIAQGNTGSFKSEVLVTSNASPVNYPLLLVTGAIITEHGTVPARQTEPLIPVEFLIPAVRANTK